MALRQSHFRPSIQHRPCLTVTASDIGLVGLVVVEEIEFDELDTLQFQLVECAVDPLRIGTDQLGIGQKTCRGSRRGITGSPIIRPIQPRPLPETLDMLPPVTICGCIRHLTQEALFSALRDFLNIPLQEHLRTIVRGVHEDTERTVFGAPPKSTESCDDHKP